MLTGASTSLFGVKPRRHKVDEPDKKDVTPGVPERILGTRWNASLQRPEFLIEWCM